MLAPYLSLLVRVTSISGLMCFFASPLALLHVGEPGCKMGDSGDICPHLDSIGEVTKEDLLLKSKVNKGSQLTSWKMRVRGGGGGGGIG